MNGGRPIQPRRHVSLSDVSRDRLGPLAKVCDKGISPDRLLGELELASSELPHPFGFALANPVRRLVAGSAEAGCFDEGFREDGAVPVTMIPVLRKPSDCHAENTGSQVSAIHLGENEESRVFNYDLEMAVARADVLTQSSEDLSDILKPRSAAEKQIAYF